MKKKKSPKTDSRVSTEKDKKCINLHHLIDETPTTVKVARNYIFILWTKNVLVEVCACCEPTKNIPLSCVRAIPSFDWTI